ncbi:MAG TPA: hypothetical protein VGM32_11155, partial [Rhodopila sp.]
MLYGGRIGAGEIWSKARLKLSSSIHYGWILFHGVAEKIQDPALTQPAKIHVSESASRLPDVTPSAKPSAVRTFLRGRGSSAIADGSFKGLVFLCALSIFGIVFLIAYELVSRSQLTLSKFGLGFFFRSAWDPVNSNFGAWPFIYGTLMSSFLGLLISVPFALGVAIFLTEMCPKWLRGPLSFLTELLAAIPSVVYGLWAIFVLIPLLRDYVNPKLMFTLGWTGFFSGPNAGY